MWRRFFDLRPVTVLALHGAKLATAVKPKRPSRRRPLQTTAAGRSFSRLSLVFHYARETPWDGSGMALVMLVLTCGMAMPVPRCTPETSLAMVEHPVTDPLMCSRSAELWGQTAAQVANSGTYDKTVCLWVPENR